MALPFSSVTAFHDILKREQTETNGKEPNGKLATAAEGKEKERRKKATNF